MIRYCGKPYEETPTVSYAASVLNFLSFAECRFFPFNVVLVQVCTLIQSCLKIYYSKPTILIETLLLFLGNLAYCGTLVHNENILLMLKITLPLQINVYFMLPCAIFTIIVYFQNHRRVDVAFVGFLGIMCLVLSHFSINHYPNVFNNKWLFFDLDYSAVLSLNIMGTLLVILSNILNRKSQVTPLLDNSHNSSLYTEWAETDKLLNSPFSDLKDTCFLKKSPPCKQVV
jgi:hypothetical protein